MKPITSPTQFELAMLAATVTREGKEPLAAVDYAWNLWCTSGEVIQRDGSTAALILERACNDEAVRKSWRDEGVMPKKFPATLNDFLRIIVRAKTPADSMKRLRDFFRHEQAENPDLYRDPADRIAEMKARDQDGGYFADFNTWRSLTRIYEGWWRSQKSSKASESASKRKPRS
jgi:hypothetical protein